MNWHTLLCGKRSKKDLYKNSKIRYYMQRTNVRIIKEEVRQREENSL